MTDPAARWIDELIDRHTQSMTRGEFLKAVRALSARYVEGRSRLGDRSPLDSAGKRAAFAAFYAPLHFLTTREIVRALKPPATAVDTIVDLGSGTGAAGAAWALEQRTPPLLKLIDRNAWVLDEARWNLRELRLRGQTARRDLVKVLQLTRWGTGLVCGWSLNELPAVVRTRALTSLLTHAAHGSPILIIEPIAGSAVPWWTDWARQVADAGGRADEWKFTAELPPRLAALDEAAGFRRDHLSARSVAFNMVQGS